MKYRLLNWFFYGHLQIALAAAALGWVSLRQGGYGELRGEVLVVLAFLFLSTLSIYTLHRMLSFRRAGQRPQSRRYNLVAVHPGSSFAVGVISGLGASIIGLRLLPAIWPILLVAVLVTVYYLTPPVPGWRRLRDLPYFKAVWVALAWTLMTHVLPIRVTGELLTATTPSSNSIYCAEMVVRFLFTGSVAVLFDFRDVVLDRSQGVRTIAGDYPVAAKWIVVLAIVICCALSGWMAMTGEGIPPALALAYLPVLPVTVWTDERRPEDWFAVVVNGTLWGPGIVSLLSGF